jgi:hypothetical protein
MHSFTLSYCCSLRLEVVIFMKSVTHAIELDKLLVSCNFTSIIIHPGLAQEERCVTDGRNNDVLISVDSIKRYTAIKAFEKRILVATDIFSREIDVERVNIVVNYDCPPDANSYLHRVGYALLPRVNMIVLSLNVYPLGELSVFEPKDLPSRLHLRKRWVLLYVHCSSSLADMLLKNITHLSRIPYTATLCYPELSVNGG